jgi:predicted dithiol-disulfide oxidoreductase (DUF899 family)
MMKSRKLCVLKMGALPTKKDNKLLILPRIIIIARQKLEHHLQFIPTHLYFTLNHNLTSKSIVTKSSSSAMPSSEQLATATKIVRWPPGTSTAYIEARNALLEEEWDLQDHVERVAARRRTLPQGAAMKAYTFTEGPTSLTETGPIKEITLQDLAADGRSVIVYHFMYDPTQPEPCPMCSLALDTFNAESVQLSRAVTFIVIGKAPIERLREWALKRNWNNLRLLSSFGNAFNKDMNLECPDYAPEVKQLPGMSVFKKDGDVVRHTYTALPHFDAKTVRGNK